MPSPDGPPEDHDPRDRGSGDCFEPIHPGGDPSLLRDLWPIAVICAILAAALIAGAGDPRKIAGPAAAGGADGRADEPSASGPGDASEAPDGGPAGPVEAALEVAARAFLGLCALCLLALVHPGARRRLLPPPRLAPRATWGGEQLLYGFLFAFATLVLVSAGAWLVPEKPAVLAPLVQAGGQLAIAGMVVALVLARPSAFPHLFGPPPASPGTTGRVREGLASLGISGRDAGANALRGAVVVAAVFPLAAGAGWLGRALYEAATGEEPGIHPVIERVAEAGPVEVAVLVAVACVAAPLFEEVFFRGFLYPSIRDRFGVAGGAVASSLVFASVHPGLPNQMATFVLGVAFCLVYERAGTLVAPVVAHALFNAVELAFVIALRAAG